MLKKFFIGFGIFLLLLIMAVIAVPFLFKDKINAKVKEEINNQLNATVDYGDFSLSLIRSFPNFSFSLDNFSVVGKDEFKGDTLAFVKNFNFTIDLMSVINGAQYKILALNIVEPNVNAKVNYEGKANWDIMKPKKETAASTSSTNFSAEIKKTKIQKGEIIYDDKKGGTFAQIHDLNFEGGGDVTQDLYDLVTKTSVAELTVKSGGVAYLSKAKLDAVLNLSIDKPNSKYTFKENTISLNELALQFDGFVQPKKDETNLDVNFKAKQTEFKNILSLIPAVYAKDFAQIKTSGSLALDGSVKGTYAGENYPAFNLNLKVNNGMFQYPSLPVAVKNIFIASVISKPQGVLDLTNVDVSKLRLEAGRDPVEGKIKIKTPVSDPDVEADITGKVDLANVPKFYPLEDVRTISGLLAMNLSFKGKKSDVDAKKYENIRAAGNAKISNLVYDSKSTPMPVRVSDMQMTFNPQNVTLNNLNAVLGKSDFHATGTLDNFMAYSFGKGDLLGSLKIISGVFDANEWLKKDENSTAKTNDTSKTEYFKVPAHIDFTADASVGKIYYEKIVLENVKGEVTVRDEALDLKNLFANVMGGNATISAKYDTKHKDYPDVSFTYDINNFDIQKTYNTVELSSKIAPVIKHIQGNFSSDLKGSGKLNRDMSVDYNSLLGDGRVEIPSAKIVDLPILQKVTEVAKIPALQNLQMNDAWTILKFKNGRVYSDPKDFKFGNGYNMNVGGSNGFDQSLDYDMRLDVPTSQLGPAQSLAQNMLAKVPGVNASLPDVVGFLFKVTGTATKPNVQLKKVLAGGNSAKDIVTNAAEDLKKNAEEEAKKQADALKQKAEEELQKQKQALEQQAKEAAEKAKRDAEQKAKEAADKAKKEAEKKLKDALKWPK